MQYRSDIDGLRALAILLVLIYHGGLTLFPSGFVGVDVFFVISGYLITNIIHQSLNQQQFSLLDFYNRRLWRLQPVLLCLIAVSILATCLFFLPDDLLQFSRSARKTLLFISNQFFKQTTTGYFAPDTQQLPLIHTWSLSIEWQCYFILPLLMYALHRWFAASRFHLIIYALTLFCWVFSLYSSQEAPAQTYYLCSSRFFEFLIGSCIALQPIDSKPRKAYVLNFLGFGALVLILYLAHLDSILTGYPNGYATLVCIATGLLIALGRSHPQRFIVKCLSIPPLVFIGLLSYSLYLWHWLVFSMLRYQNIDESPQILVMAYSVTFVLAFLSWNYIEKPARRKKHLKFSQTLLSLLIVPLVLIHALDYLLKINSGFPQRFNEELVQVYQQLKRYDSVQRPHCIDNEVIPKEQECTLGPQRAQTKKALLIGDSFSNHYWGFVSKLAEASNMQVLVQGTSSCITLPGIYLYDWWYFKGRVYQACHDRTEAYYRMIQNNHYDYVFIGQIWANYLSESVIQHLGDKRSLPEAKKRIEQALDEALHQISTSGARPVLIQSTAVMQANMHQCFLKHIKLRQAYHPEQCAMPLRQSVADRWFNHLFAQMKIKYPQLIIIDPKKVQCHNNQCPADIQGIPVFRDVGHLTDYASYQFGIQYLKKFGNPLSA